MIVCFMLILHWVMYKFSPLKNYIFFCIIPILILLCFSLSYTAKDNSFYVSLHAEFTSQDQESLQITMKKSGSNASNTSVEFRFVNFFLDNLPLYCKNQKLKAFYHKD